MSDKRTKKFTKVVTINIFKIQTEALLLWLIFKLLSTHNGENNQTLSKQSKIKNFAPVKIFWSLR